MPKAIKGSVFERAICKKLSLWWSKGERDDIFWRTAGSGARATVRRKVHGVTTANSSGDICAMDPVGKPLVDMFTFELKRGYSKTSFADAFDAPARAKPQLWQQFVEQAYLAHLNEKSKYWALILRRNGREALIFFPVKFLSHVDYHTIPFPKGRFTVPLKSRSKMCGLPSQVSVAVCKLQDFLDKVSANDIRNILHASRKT